MFYQPHFDLKADEILMYLRKSRSDDPLLSDEEVLSKHEAILDDWSEKYLGFKIPAKNRFREVVSGETLDDRPEILNILRMVESPKYKSILVVEVQRLSRGDLEDAGRLIKLLRYTNTTVLTPTKTYDICNEYDRELFERELKRGNEYLEYTKKILKRGRLLSVSQGNYIGAIAPYGYTKTTVNEGNKKCHTLAINEEQADVVRMIFDMYVNKDMGRTNICHKLDDMGIKPPKGKLWSPPALKDMLENVHYIGKVKWNWRKTIKIVEESEIIETRPKSKIGEFLIYEGKHEAIISEELFNRAREKQGKNHRAKPKTKIRNPLAGLLFCQCGRAMSLRTYRKNGEERADARLLCDDQVHCGTGSVVYDEMIEHISDILRECIEDFEVRLENDEGNSVKLHNNLIKNLEKKKKELEEKELAQWEAQASPDPAQRMPAHIFQKLNERLLKEKEEIQQALCKAYESMPEPVDYEEKIVSFKEALDALENPNVSAIQKNTLLKKVIERIDYRRDKPERVRSTAKRVTVNGRRIRPNGLKTGATWTNPPFEIDVKLKL